MAEQIENGEVEAESLIIISPKDCDWPDVFGFGNDRHLDSHSVIGWLEIAKSWFIAYTTER